MSDFDPLAIFQKPNTPVIGGGMIGGDTVHRPERENLDELALESLGKRATPRMAAELARHNLVPIHPGAATRTHYAPHAYDYHQEINSNHVPQVPQIDPSIISNLEAKIAFLREKLQLCESKLTEEQIKEYKLDWMMKIADAAGEDMMIAAGRGFQEKHTATAAAQPKPIVKEEKQELSLTEQDPNPDDISVEDIMSELEDENYDSESEDIAGQIQEELPDYLRG